MTLSEGPRPAPDAPPGGEPAAGGPPDGLVDSHCHLTDRSFEEDRGPVLARAREAGVRSVITVGSDVADSRAAAGLAGAHDDVWASAGVHPHEAARAGDGDLEELRGLLARPGVVAVGETGLDYHHEHSPRAVQRRWFERQIELAGETGLPVIVHSRDADEDTADVVRDLPAGLTGVLHCFTGARPLLEAGLEAGWCVSFSGIASFEGFEGAGLVGEVPPDRLLIETDAPYLAPVPRRGRRNEPAYVRYVCEAVARLRGEPPVEVARTTAANAARLFRLPDGRRG